MKQKEQQFLELLSQARSVFSEDNVTQSPSDIDMIIERTDNEFLTYIKDKRNHKKIRKHVENLLVERIESNLANQKIYEEKLQELKVIYNEQLESFTDISHEELVDKINDIRTVEEDLPEDVVDTVELTEVDIHKVLSGLENQYESDNNVSLTYVEELRAKY